MSIDPKKAILFIEGNQVRYKEGGMNGVVKTFNMKPVQAVFQGTDIIVTLENGSIRKLSAPLYNYDQQVR